MSAQAQFPKEQSEQDEFQRQDNAFRDLVSTNVSTPYPNLDGYLRDLYQQPGIAETVHLDHIKRHYYITHDDINPTRLVPVGPVLYLTKPHGRERLEER